MVEIALFHYRSDDTPLHRYDARHKLPVLILLAAALFRVTPAGLGALTVLLAVAFAASRLPVGVAARELRSFALLLVLMFAAQALTSSSLAAGGLLVWRIAGAVVLGALFSATTPLAQIRAAVSWYLRPFRFLPGGRIATMLELTVALIPLVFDTEREISEAQRARCVENARRPLRRLRTLAVPLLIKTFARADTTAQAMESRCYSDERTMPRLQGGRFDWLYSIVAGGGAIALLVLARA